MGVAPEVAISKEKPPLFEANLVALGKTEARSYFKRRKSYCRVLI